jgi:replicative DNA helicase
MSEPIENLEAERAVLGSIMVDSAVLSDVSGLLIAEDFSTAQNRLIYSAMMRVTERGSVPDLITVKDDLEDAADVVYLASLVDDIPDVARALHYAGIVKEKANLRAMLALSRRAAARIEAGGVPAVDLARDLAETCYEVIETATSTEGFVDADAASTALMARMDRVASGVVEGVRSHIVEIDEVVTSFEPGDTTLICGETSHGKTQLCIWLAREMAAHGAKVGFVSLEMPLEQITARFVSQISGYSYQEVMRATADAASHRQAFLDVTAGLEAYRKLGISTFDGSDVALASLVSHVRGWKRRHGLDIVFIDYIQLIHDGGGKRNEEVARLSRGLKRLARIEKIPVIVVSQLSRMDSRSEEKRPSLRRLMDSSQLEKDATVVIGTYWEHRDDPDKDWKRLELLFLKNRNGATGTLECDANWRCGRFSFPYQPPAEG